MLTIQIAAQNQKEKSLEGLRGAAALIVFFAHFAAAFKPQALFGGANDSFTALFYKTPLGILLAGNFAVSLFFIMSGYVLSIKHFSQPTNNIEIQGDAVKRYIRLGIPLLATCSVSFLLSRGGFYFNDDVAALTQNSWFNVYFQSLPGQSLGGFLRDMLLALFPQSTTYNPPAWTIGIELIGSYLTFGMVAINRSFRFRALVYISAFLLLHGNALQGFIIGLAAADTRVTFGQFEARLKSSGIRFYGMAYLMVGVALLMAGFPFYLSQAAISESESWYRSMLFLDNRDFWGGGITLISGSLLFLAYPYTVLRLWLETPWMQILGKYSFMLYLTHFLCLSSIASFTYLHTVQLGQMIGLGLTFGVYSLSTSLLTLVMVQIADRPSLILSQNLKLFYLTHLQPEKPL